MPTASVADPTPRRVRAPAGYPFPDSAEAFLEWSFARDLLERARFYWLATTGDVGTPYLTPLWGVWVDDALYLDGAPTTRWARNMHVRPKVAFHVGDGEQVVIVDGVADDYTADPALGGRIVDAWTGKYGSNLPEPATDGVFRVRPTVARAWSRETFRDGTAWDFPETT